MTAGRAPRRTEVARATGAARLTEADRAAWAGFTRNIVPRSGSAEAPPPPAAATPPPPVPGRAAAHVPPAAAVPPLAIGAAAAGVDSATWQRFRTGKLAAQRKLDLHGMTAQHAFHALTAFLRAARTEHLRCVEVITGRGSRDDRPWTDGAGVIRREFPLWLNRPDIRPLVLGAAHPHAANPGAVRLLLRRLR